MIIIMALLIIAGAVSFASTTLSTAAPLFGAAILLGILWAIKLLATDSFTWNKSLIHLPVAAFAVYAIIRYFTSPLEYQSRVELFQILTCTFIYFIAAFNFHHGSDRMILILTLLLLGMGESILAIAQVFTNATTLFGYPRYEMYFGRGSGTFFCPNHLAALLEMIIGLAIARLVLNTSAKEDLQKMALQKVFLIFCILVLMAGIVETASRSGLIATIASLAVLLFWGGWNLRRYWHTFLVAGCGAVLLLVLVIKTQGPTQRFLMTYFNTKTAETQAAVIKTSTLGTRVSMWQSTIAMIREHPISGSGGGTWGYLFPKYRSLDVPGVAEYPHNELLNLLSDYGLIGFALIAVALTCFYGHTYGLMRANIPAEERSFALGVAMAVTAALVHAVFDFNFHIFANSAVFMALMGFTVAIKYNPSEQHHLQMGKAARRILAVAVITICGLGSWFVGYSVIAHRYTVVADDFRLNDWQVAEYLYTKAMRLDTKSPIPPTLLGDLYLNQSQWRFRPADRKDLSLQAIDSYKQALKFNPYDAMVYNHLARAYQNIDDKENMFDACKHSAELDPNTPFVPLFLARYYFAEDDLDNAEKAAIKAVELNYGYYQAAPGDLLQQIREAKEEAKRKPVEPPQKQPN
jgi:O-antigen ligase